MKKQVWLNINTGKFSNSWSPFEEEKHIEEVLKIYKEGKEKFSGWKLIEYECKNDEKFEFNNNMKIR